jgi:plastocyanin
MHTTCPLPRSLVCSPLLALLLALGVQPAPAAELQVYVTTPDGKPAPDVVVAVLPRGTATPPRAPAGPPVVIAQREIRFQPYVTAVPLGTTVRFVNRDRFDHHVRSQPGGALGSVAPAQSFEFRLKAARGGVEPSADLTMDAPGATALGCHLHGSMRGHIYVSPTPWVAVTDAAGRAVLEDAPDGAADLRLWHPDQLVAQANVAVQLAGAVTTQATLNFSPRRRPPPRPKGEYEY